MITPAMHRAPPLPLAVRRASLIARIHAAREETSDVVRMIAADVRATERTRRSIHSVWKILKASVVAAGVIWSVSATSRIGRGRRFFTLAVSLLSTMRAMRKVSAFVLPLTQSLQKQG